MKLTVKTLKGSHFEIEVNPNDSIMAVKKNIEEMQGKDSYPWGQQLLIHNGKVLKDETTLADNKVSENGFLVVMLSKSKTSGAIGTSSHQPSINPSPVHARPLQLSPLSQSSSESVRNSEANGQAASNVLTGSNNEQMIQQLINMGSGNWDRDTVLHALRAAYYNPERAVEYLYSGIPENEEVANPVVHLPSSQMHDYARSITEESAPVSGIPNSSPLNMFPQGTISNLDGDLLPGSLDFLKDSVQFQRLRAMIKSNPQIIQPMLQELGKQNPQLLSLIQEHYTEFLQLLNDAEEEAEMEQFDESELEMTHAIGVTQEEQNSIGRLEAMGFERALVIEAFLACDRNEELAANYLLEHSDEDD